MRCGEKNKKSLLSFIHAFHGKSRMATPWGRRPSISTCLTSRRKAKRHLFSTALSHTPNVDKAQYLFFPFPIAFVCVCLCAGYLPLVALHSRAGC